MTIRTKSEYLEYIEGILPDNTSRLISPADLRSAFTDLADSLGIILDDTLITSLNFSSDETRTTIAGDLALSQISLANRSSIDNSAFGYKALNINYTGSRNTALGSLTLACNSFGSDNVAVGYNSLGSNTVGSGNVAVGSYSLVENARGDFNIAIGHGAAYYVDDNSNFKFYLGAYPHASGGCDQTLNESGVPPLLYGDLSSRQLGVGTDIFVDGDVGLAVSGDLLPASGQTFSIGTSDYRWDAAFRNVTVAGTIDVPLAWSFSLADQFGTSGVIDKDDVVMLSGVSGIETIYFHDQIANKRVMEISAYPISGWVSGQLSNIESDIVAISGKNGQLLSLSGQLDNVSGWTLYNFDNVIYPDLAEISGVDGLIDSVSGWADYNLNEISGYNGLLNQLSGIADGTIYQVSGWSRDEITSVSGLDRRQDGSVYGLAGVLGGHPNGLIYLASGWNKAYTDSKIVEAGGFAFWEIEGQHGASGMVHHADTLMISGISGIETRMITDEGAGGTSFYNLAISAAPVSGWASGYIKEQIGISSGYLASQITASAVLISGWASAIAASEADDAYDLSYTDFANGSGWTEYSLNQLSGALPSLWGGPSGLIWAASGWAFDNLTQISGVNGQLDNVSGYLKDYLDDKVIQAGSYVFWEIEDTHGGSGQVEHSDTLIVSGVSGIRVELGLGEDSVDTGYRLDISAAPLSGYISDRFNIVSGVIEDISGVGGFVSGQVLDAIKVAVNQIDDIASELDSSLVGTLTENYFDPFAEDFVEISGKGGIIDQVSGWTENYIEAVSGFNEYYTTEVSGWAGGYVLQQINNIEFPDGQDQYVAWFAEANSGPSQAVGPNKRVKYIGKDGISTTVRNNAGINEVDFSALAITEDLNEISGVDGLIDQKIAKAGGEGNLYVWNIDNGINTSQIGGGDNVLFSGISGISVFVEQDVDQVLISAEGVQSALDTLESRVDCLVNVNCPETGSESAQNVSGWALSNLNTLSGLDPTIYGTQGLIWSVSGRIDSKLIEANQYDYWDATDGTATAEIRNTETVKIHGVSGVGVSLDAANNTFRVEAGALSGLSVHGLLAISGVGGLIDQRLSDTDRGILGQAKFFTRQQLNIVSGVKDGTLAKVSGYFENVLLNEISGVDTGLIHKASGWNENYTHQVSGWADYNLNAVSGLDGVTDNISGYFADELLAVSGLNGLIDSVSGWTDYNLDVIYEDLVEISGVGGLIDSVESNTYRAASGIELSTDNTFITAGSGRFDKVILSRRVDASDPSGQVVANTGAYHDIVNASGYLIVPKYNTFEGLKTTLPASPANSGAVVFANDRPYQSQGYNWSKPVMIEGILVDEIDSPSSYTSPTSGRLTVKNDLFVDGYEEYVINRDFFLEISGGLFCVASLVNGEYRPIYASCSGT